MSKDVKSSGKTKSRKVSREPLIRRAKFESVSFSNTLDENLQILIKVNYCNSSDANRQMLIQISCLLGHMLKQDSC